MSTLPNVRQVDRPLIFLWRRPTAATIRKIKAASYGRVSPMPTTQVIDTLKFLHPDGAVFEVCAIGLKTPTSKLWTGKAYGKKPLAAGWFKDPVMAAKLAVPIEAEGIYCTLNPCQDALLARADHRLQAGVARTADQDIAGIKNLLVDIDARRPAGVSSTDAEHAAALEMAQVIRADLAKEGWSGPLVADSGNGGHLDYPLDLPNTQENVALVRAVLEALALRYQEQLLRLNLAIDQTVFNPSRLVKLYGTWVKKGDSTPDRPHRMARIVSLPAARQPVPVELLKKLAATAGAGATTTATTASPQAKKPRADAGGWLDVEAYLAHHQVDIVKVKPHQGGMLYCLKECLFDPAHADNEAAIKQAADGKLSYQCFHKSCKRHTWAEARQKISGTDRLDRFVIGGNPRRALALAPQPRAAAPAPTVTPGLQRSSAPVIRLVSGKELENLEFPEPKWIVQDIVPDGVCVFSSRPKKGKTRLATGLAVAVATGGYALGKPELRAVKGKVLYLCLEDKLLRMKRLLKKILGDSPFPEDLILTESWPRLDKGGLEALQDFLKEHDDCHLVVIDSLAKVKPPRPKTVDPYDFDMALGGALQNLAHQYQICLLVIYHNRKAEAEDPLDEVIGSTGLTGAVDAVLVLRRGRGKVDGTLFITGRDVEEQELALKFHPAEGFWELMGDAADYAMSEARQEVMQVLRENGPRTAREVSEFIGKKYENVKRLLWKMSREQEVKSVNGKYEIIKK